jgi:hypothetical protein
MRIDADSFHMNRHPYTSVLCQRDEREDVARTDRNTKDSVNIRPATRLDGIPEKNSDCSSILRRDITASGRANLSFTSYLSAAFSSTTP